MRIGVDVSCWSNLRGFGRFTRELLTAILQNDKKNQYLFFADQQTVRQSTIPPDATIIPAETSVAVTAAASASGRRSIKDLWSMNRAVAKTSLDVFFFPAIYSYFPISNRVKIAVTIHDMTPAAFSSSVFPNKKLELFWNLKERAALWQADRIVTVSNYSKDQIANLRKVPKAKIDVISEAGGKEFRKLPHQETAGIRSRFGLQQDDRLLLYVGGISPHKNLRSLVKVFCRLKEANPGLKLLLAGDYEKDSFFSDFQEINELAKNLRIMDHIVFTGYVTDAELARLYNAAALFVFPSFQEGFGLPAVEAMACGTPIAASSAGSLPEIIGDAGEFYDPRKSEEMFQTISRLLQDEALLRKLSERGLERAKQFDWNLAAQQAIKIFEKMMEN